MWYVCCIHTIKFIKVRKIFLIIIIGFFSNLYSQPIKVSDIISENKITSFSEQKLILIDFWATWCGPCVYATKQLEILQLHNKNKVFVISISDEHETKISDYLKRKPIDLMVTSDYENHTFEKYNVQLRPYSVLLDLRGNLLWKGSPSDLSQTKLDNFYNAQSNTKSLNNLGKILKVKHEEVVSSKVLVGDKKLLIYKLKSDENELNKNDDEVFYSGTLSNLFFALKSSYPFELKFGDDLDKKLKIISTKNMWDYESDVILEEVFKFFKLKSEVKEENFEGVELIVSKRKMLWDSKQFNWEGSPSNYIIGTDRIQADNMSIKSLCSLLSRETQINYVYRGKDNSLHDWDFHYKFEELMKGEFESSFGIKFKPTKLLIPITYISKK